MHLPKIYASTLHSLSCVLLPHSKTTQAKLHLQNQKLTTLRVCPIDRPSPATRGRHIQGSLAIAALGFSKPGGSGTRDKSRVEIASKNRGDAFLVNPHDVILRVRSDIRNALVVEDKIVALDIRADRLKWPGRLARRGVDGHPSVHGGIRVSVVQVVPEEPDAVDAELDRSGWRGLKDLIFQHRGVLAGLCVHAEHKAAAAVAHENLAGGRVESGHAIEELALTDIHNLGHLGAFTAGKVGAPDGVGAFLGSDAGGKVSGNDGKYVRGRLGDSKKTGVACKVMHQRGVGRVARINLIQFRAVEQGKEQVAVAALGNVLQPGSVWKLMDDTSIAAAAALA